ncbi:MAG: CHAT domain-containing protein, partial [Microcystaceae cyanobacterium]
ATSNGLFTPVPVANANRRDLLAVQKQFQNNLVNLAAKETYLPQSIKLYEWLIAPMKEMLEKQGINHISFILDTGLRSLPIAALYDQKKGKYLIEEFSLGLMPSLSLTNITRKTETNPKVLAMGADTFTEQKPLPAVPAELEEIAKVLWNGRIYLNPDFTVKNFKTAIATREFNIVHLATHGEFQPGNRNNSFVVFTDQNLKMDQFANTGLDQPIDLMTLSACRTALGDPQAELGFAGIAVKTGVRTAIGSLWYVSDEGTFALMTNFYNYLKKAPTKAQSLQQAQRGMIAGQVDINKDGQIMINNLSIRGASLPPQVREGLSTKDISHPYFWSAFTVIGNPW